MSPCKSVLVIRFVGRARTSCEGRAPSPSVSASPGSTAVFYLTKGLFGRCAFLGDASCLGVLAVALSSSSSKLSFFTTMLLEPVPFAVPSSNLRVALLELRALAAGDVLP